MSSYLITVAGTCFVASIHDIIVLFQYVAKCRACWIGSVGQDSQSVPPLLSVGAFIAEVQLSIGLRTSMMMCPRGNSQCSRQASAASRRTSLRPQRSKFFSSAGVLNQCISQERRPSRTAVPGGYVLAM